MFYLSANFFSLMSGICTTKTLFGGSYYQDFDNIKAYSVVVCWHWINVLYYIICIVFGVWQCSFTNCLYTWEPVLRLVVLVNALLKFRLYWNSELGHMFQQYITHLKGILKNSSCHLTGSVGCVTNMILSSHHHIKCACVGPQKILVFHFSSKCYRGVNSNLNRC